MSHDHEWKLRVVAFVDGDSTDEEVGRHLADCAECGELADGLGGDLAFARRVTELSEARERPAMEPVLSRGRKIRWRRWGMQTAAAGAIVLALVVMPSAFERPEVALSEQEIFDRDLAALEAQLDALDVLAATLSDTLALAPQAAARWDRAATPAWLADAETAAVLLCAGEILEDDVGNREAAESRYRLAASRFAHTSAGRAAAKHLERFDG